MDTPITSSTAIVEGNEFHHMTDVLRHKVGYKTILCDNSGYDFYATIERIEKNYAVCRIDEKVKNPTETEKDISLYICAIKSEKMDLAIQKAVELGVKRIIPVISQLTNEKNVRIERLERIIMEASKQCGRASLCKISNPKSFDNVLIDMTKSQSAIMAYENEDKTMLRDLDLKDKQSIALLVGSEGGFSNREAEILRKKAGGSVTLGSRILRADTASVAVVSALMYEWGEWRRK